MGKVAKTIFLAPVKFYQKFISPALGKNCIYSPSCSHYMVEAVEKHGVVKGGLLGIARILRCSKLYLGGEDPVPEQFNFKALKTPYIVFRRRTFLQSLSQRRKSRSEQPGYDHLQEQ